MSYAVTNVPRRLASAWHRSTRGGRPEINTKKRMALALIGVVLDGGAFALTRLLENLLFQVAPPTKYYLYRCSERAAIVVALLRVTSRR
jgi:hypothetical protein